jgi:hypothetical protein
MKHLFVCIIFIILILLLFWSNNDTFDTVGDRMLYVYDTLYHKLINGQTYYHSLSKDENLEGYLRNKDKAVILFLAPWCKYSKELRKNKSIKKITCDIDTVIIDDKHPDVEFLMNVYKLKKFPSICIYKNKYVKEIKEIDDLVNQLL